jgi:DNA-binding CsgD family transcriptional regulator
MSQKYSIKIDAGFHNLCSPDLNKILDKNVLQFAQMVSTFYRNVAKSKSINSYKILILPNSIEVEFIDLAPDSCNILLENAEYNASEKSESSCYPTEYKNSFIGFEQKVEPNELLSCLTSREIEVLTLIDKGKSNKEIAQMLCLTISTVKTHILNIFGKLRVNKRIQAISKAKELKIIPKRLLE